MRIIGERIYLRRLEIEDVSDKYVNWLNDSKVNEYLESRFSVHTIESTKEYIKSVSNDRNYAMGIFLINNDYHIGNVKIGNINNHHNYADIGFLIGEKSFWGQGYGTEAVSLATKFGFSELDLYRLYGGCYSVNVGSSNIFKKCLYSLEGIEKGKYLLNNGNRCDGLIYGCINGTF